MTNIAIDTTFFGHEEIKKETLSLSTSIFTADLLDAFAKLGKADLFTLIVNFNHKTFFEKRFPQYKLCVVKWFPVTLLYKLTNGKKTATSLIKKFGNYKQIVEKQNFSAIWFPYAMDQTFIKTKIKTYATIHDIFRILHGTEKEKQLFKSFIEDKSTFLFSVSDYTKQNILENTICKKEIKVIPNSIIMDVSKTKAISALENKKYILDINAYIQKKNPITLLKAFSLIKDKTDAILVFCGGYKEEYLFTEMKNFIAKESLEEKVKLLFRIPDEERNWLLTNATLFVTPSLFEGFGRTPVEAAICKIPVISTKETSLFEATRGLCNYIKNSKDEKEFASLILEKLQNPDSKEKLEKFSEKLVSEYAPLKCAKKYLEVLENNHTIHFTRN